MKTEESLEATISAETLHLAARFVALEDSNFAAQIRFLRLDPAHDFKHADLSCMDFSNSDVRGFDFSGSDLRGVFGADIQWDSTTNFSGAITSESVFSYSLSKRRFFEANPEYAERVERLKNEHWANVILTIEAM